MVFQLEILPGAPLSRTEGLSVFNSYNWPKIQLKTERQQECLFIYNVVHIFLPFVFQHSCRSTAQWSSLHMLLVYKMSFGFTATWAHMTSWFSCTRRLCFPPVILFSDLKAEQSYRANSPGQDAAYLHHLVVDDYRSHESKNSPEKHRQHTCDYEPKSDLGFINCHGFLRTARRA